MIALKNCKCFIASNGTSYTKNLIYLSNNCKKIFILDMIKQKSIENSLQKTLIKNALQQTFISTTNELLINLKLQLNDG